MFVYAIGYAYDYPGQCYACTIWRKATAEEVYQWIRDCRRSLSRVQGRCKEIEKKRQILGYGLDGHDERSIAG